MEEDLPVLREARRKFEEEQATEDSPPNSDAGDPDNPRPQ